MNSRQKWLICCLCLCLATVFTFSAVSIACHADHECAGDNCKICLQISFLKSSLKQLEAAVFAMAFLLAAVCALPARFESDRPRRCCTLISLKIRLNN